jgi:ATP-binding cassette subfamily F protein 3
MLATQEDTTKPLFTYETVKAQLKEKVPHYDDEIVLDFIAKIIIDDQPKNELLVCQRLKKWLDDESRNYKEEDIILASKEVYANMLYFGFVPVVKKSEGLMKYEEFQTSCKAALPELIIHHDRDISHKVDLCLENVTISIGNKVICEEATIKINYGRRYVLIGRNGLGKTTILNNIARKEIDGIPEHLTILHVEQEVVANENTLLDEVLTVDVERCKLLKERDTVSDRLDFLEFGAGKGTDEAEEEIQPLSDRYVEINERLTFINSDDAENIAIEILKGLGFSNADLSKKTRQFSGGWRMRISLAKALYAKPDILLLDEPTNHLDMEAVMWLEEYLIEWPYTIVIVSHARSFINNVATDIINFVEGKFVYYKGNYDDFVKARNEKYTNMAKIKKRQEKDIAHLQYFIDRFRANAKRASLVQSKIKMINKMEIEDEVMEDPAVIFIFPEVEELNPPLLRLTNVSLGYNKVKIINKTNFYLDQQSRIAVVGPNGAGKSTLMKCLYEQLNEMEGSIYRHPKLKVAMFTQHHADQLDLDQTPLETIGALMKDPNPEEVRFYLAGFGIQGNLSMRPNYMLSGGQKTRVALAALVFKKPHIILMDEPTNHMDIDAVNALAIALNNYNGGVVIVSHDEYFVETVCNQIWIVGKGKCEKYNGNFLDYRKLVRKDM